MDRVTSRIHENWRSVLLVAKIWKCQRRFGYDWIKLFTCIVEDCLPEKASCLFMNQTHFTWQFTAIYEISRHPISHVLMLCGNVYIFIYFFFFSFEFSTDQYIYFIVTSSLPILHLLCFFTIIDAFTYDALRSWWCLFIFFFSMFESNFTAYLNTHTRVHLEWF